MRRQNSYISFGNVNRTIIPINREARTMYTSTSQLIWMACPFFSHWNHWFLILCSSFQSKRVVHTYFHRTSWHGQCSWCTYYMHIFTHDILQICTNQLHAQCTIPYTIYSSIACSTVWPTMARSQSNSVYCIFLFLSRSQSGSEQEQNGHSVLFSHQNKFVERNHPLVGIHEWILNCVKFFEKNRQKWRLHRRAMAIWRRESLLSGCCRHPPNVHCMHFSRCGSNVCVHSMQIQTGHCISALALTTLSAIVWKCANLRMNWNCFLNNQVMLVLNGSGITTHNDQWCRRIYSVCEDPNAVTA